jgi:hypothetical protein
MIRNFIALIILAAVAFMLAALPCVASADNPSPKVSDPGHIDESLHIKAITVRLKDQYRDGIPWMDLIGTDAIIDNSINRDDLVERFEKFGELIPITNEYLLLPLGKWHSCEDIHKYPYLKRSHKYLDGNLVRYETETDTLKLGTKIKAKLIKKGQHNVTVRLNIRLVSNCGGVVMDGQMKRWRFP